MGKVKLAFEDEKRSAALEDHGLTDEGAWCVGLKQCFAPGNTGFSISFILCETPATEA